MQNQRFSELEGLQIAAEIERRGGELYRRAARVNQNPKTQQALVQLAREEEVHEREFLRLASQLRAARGDAEPPEDELTPAFLSATAADIAFSGGLMELVPGRGFEDPAAVLRYAIESEQNSIAFYRTISEQVRTEEQRLVFQEIIRQEKNHLDQLKKMLDERGKR